MNCVINYFLTAFNAPYICLKIRFDGSFWKKIRKPKVVLFADSQLAMQARHVRGMIGPRTGAQVETASCTAETGRGPARQRPRPINVHPLFQNKFNFKIRHANQCMCEIIKIIFVFYEKDLDNVLSLL